MPKVVFSDSARDDLQSIVAYTKESWGKAQAVSYVSGLRKQTKILAEMPTIGRIYSPYKRQEIRVFSYGKHLIYYCQQSHGITVIHVTHESMEQSLHVMTNGSAQSI